VGLISAVLPRLTAQRTTPQPSALNFGPMVAAMQDFSLLHSRATKQPIGNAVKNFVTFVSYP
jgi:hypothetical protein